MNPRPTKVVTGKIRASYEHLLEPYAFNEDDEPRYSMVALIPKSDTATVNKIRAAQQAALEAGKHKFKGGRVPSVWNDTLRDGDTDDSIDLDKSPEYAGHYFMSVSSKTKPGVVDANLNPILDSEEVYSGMYCRISMNAFTYNVKGNQGVSFGLNHVQKLSDGDFLGGRTRAEDDFDVVESDDSGLL